jgi:tRNA-2-methylthio-N6-dimethylallyladenosine synthase
MRYYIETFGCEMNDYDSDFIASRLRERGFTAASTPEGADVLIFNTCSVRAGAEQRARARIARSAGWKRRRPDLSIAVVGCMAQRLGADLGFENGLVDLIVGTDRYRELPDLIAASRERAGGGPLVSTESDSGRTYGIDELPAERLGPCANLTVMQGCDKFCSFCIVPYTRGRERAKAAAEVVGEARRLVAGGVREITLLGQNVNSYRAADVDFATLLRRLDEIEGLARLRFTSSYPRDMTEDVLQAIAECRAPIEHLHLPVQSGSDRTLRRMQRRHTVEWYVRLVDRARELIPGVQLSSDLMVGFPGETEGEFRATLRLVERVRFAECFMYKYSPRAGTPAARLPDDVGEEEKARRLEELIRLQRRIGQDVLCEQLGRRAEVLIEGPSRRNPAEPFGHTRNRFRVVLPEATGGPGDLVDVELAELRGSTFRGIPVGARRRWDS